MLIPFLICRRRKRRRSLTRSKLYEFVFVISSSFVQKGLVSTLPPEHRHNTLVDQSLCVVCHAFALQQQIPSCIVPCNKLRISADTHPLVYHRPLSGLKLSHAHQRQWKTTQRSTSAAARPCESVTQQLPLRSELRPERRLSVCSFLGGC